MSHLENVSEEEINRLLGMVVDVENLFMSVHKEEDTDTKQVYFYLFKVRLGLGTLHRVPQHCRGAGAAVPPCPLPAPLGARAVTHPASPTGDLKHRPCPGSHRPPGSELPWERGFLPPCSEVDAGTSLAVQIGAAPRQSSAASTAPRVPGSWDFGNRVRRCPRSSCGSVSCR